LRIAHGSLPRRNPQRRRTARSRGKDPKTDPADSLEHPGIADAYAIQKAWVEMKVAQGRIVKGHKIGLTSKAMQSALNIDEPDSGILLDDMFFADGGKGDTIQADYGPYGSVSCYFA
jgi:2-keto-4-pentenoate hydratase